MMNEIKFITNPKTPYARAIKFWQDAEGEWSLHLRDFDGEIYLTEEELTGYMKILNKLKESFPTKKENE